MRRGSEEKRSERRKETKGERVEEGDKTEGGGEKMMKRRGEGEGGKER